MARAGGGSRSGGFGSRGTSGRAFGGGSWRGNLQGNDPRQSEGAPFVDVAPAMVFIGGTPKRHIRWLSAILAVFLFISSFGCIYLVLNGSGGEKIDGVIYDEEVFQEYADRCYNDAFRAYGGLEDNLLIVFLANRDANEFYCITWVGENLRKEIVNLFGDETTDFGITTMTTVNGNYADHLDTNLISIVEHMTASVESLSLESSFITDFSIDTRPKSYLINYTELDIDKYAVSDSLEEFTEKTGVPIVITLDYMDNVFKKPYQQQSTVFAVLFLLLCGIVVMFIIVKSILKAKRYIKKDDNDSKKRNDTKYGKDYDRSRYNKKI